MPKIPHTEKELRVALTIKLSRDMQSTEESLTQDQEELIIAKRIGTNK